MKIPKVYEFFSQRVGKTALPVQISGGINSLLMIPRGKAMGKTKLIVREVFRGGRSLEELIAPLILCDTALTAEAESVIIESTEQSQDSLCSGKGANDGTSDE